MSHLHVRCAGELHLRIREREWGRKGGGGEEVSGGVQGWRKGEGLGFRF